MQCPYLKWSEEWRKWLLFHGCQAQLADNMNCHYPAKIVNQNGRRLCLVHAPNRATQRLQGFREYDVGVAGGPVFSLSRATSDRIIGNGKVGQVG